MVRTCIVAQVFPAAERVAGRLGLHSENRGGCTLGRRTPASAALTSRVVRSVRPPAASDRRDAEGQKAVFTADTLFSFHMGVEGSEPTCVLEGRDASRPYSPI